MGKYKNKSKINETKSCLLEKINKIAESLDRIIRRKQKLVFRMTGDCILNSTDIKRTIKKYYELHDNTFNHLD